MQSKQPIHLEQGWSRIQNEGINKIIDVLENQSMQGFTKRQYSELYTLVYNMCMQRPPNNFSHQLYVRYSETIEHYLKTNVKPVLESKAGNEFLKDFRTSWENHRVMMKWMRHFFQYLDRHHVNQNNLPSLYSLAMDLYYKEIFQFFKKRVIKDAVNLLECDRENQPSDRDLLKEVSSIFINLEETKQTEVYSELESEVLSSTGEYYESEAARWVAENNCPEFILKAEKVIIEELQRAQTCLSESTVQKIEGVVFDVIVRKNQATLLEKETGIKYLLEYNKEEDLARLYRLCSKFKDGLQPIASAFTSFVKKEGNKILSEKENKDAKAKRESSDDPEFVKSFMDLHRYFKHMVSDSFRNNAVFQRALGSAFEELLNNKVGKLSFAEILATYSDKILKKSSDRMRDEELEETISRVVELFEHLEDKDLFAVIYKGQLAKRLLNGLSASEDAEKTLISKMKLCCGAQFTAKMEGMITDLALAEDIRTKFEEAKPELPIEFSALVLTNSYWPSYKNYTLTLPNSMLQSISSFNHFYGQITSQRKLTWMNCLGTVVLSGNFPVGRYDFVCTTYQACLLYMFNEVHEMSFEEILRATNFDVETCKRVLVTLACSKSRVLKKSSEGRKISEEDVFRIKEDFQSNIIKVKFPLPKWEESYSKENVAKDRNLAIEAAIVRIMKSRRVMSHQSLVTEVMSLLSVFRPQVRDIKSRIENLISREFLERDKNDPTVYNYLA